MTTDSTHPEPGVFNKSASTIARSLASKKVSPKGPASGMRMLNFYINRAGKNLPEERKAELEKAKDLLSAIIKKQKAKSETGYCLCSDGPRSEEQVGEAGDPRSKCGEDVHRAILAVFIPLGALG